MFIAGNIYNRKNDIHAIYSGQQQGGISTPTNYPIIFIFSRKSKQKFGYSDGWTKDGIFEFTGEGQIGPMKFTKGNKAIRDHVKDGKDIYLFKYVESGSVRPGSVKFIGQMICIGYHLSKSKDKGKNLRDAIVFELAPIDKLCEITNEDTGSAHEAEDIDNSKTLEELRQLAEESSDGYKEIEEKKKHVRIRSNAVKLYALKRANGICECCQNKAPFIKDNGEPYLEVHHIKRLSDGGPDKPKWVAAVCPNCHRELHYGQSKLELKDRLLNYILEKESTLKNKC